MGTTRATKPAQIPLFPSGIPAYDLYGEAQARARLDPVHLEALFTRSQRHDWTIRPHRHRTLHQVFWVQQGSGQMQVERREFSFEAPFLLLMPAGTVHGFRYASPSSGYVLTLTDAFLDSCRKLTQEAWHPRDGLELSLRRREPLCKALDMVFTQLEREFRWSGAGRNTAITGHVLLILSLLQRGAAAEASARRPHSPQAELVARFRRHLEDRFTEHGSLRMHCQHLGVAPSTLARACRAVTGSSPLELAHERLMLEARRMLSYSSMSISQVAYALGFEPAYFSRFFTKREGVSPIAFRRAMHGEEGEP
ncbi:helix-turn-helix domain-containing protein [Roseomonas marmotae]|uniref:Helix-turn-helix domain-containing protein n=1 Tax=Roseomonas marmotae TaxID=2768161 RepID=A0ABS3KFU0_9PROT|nr:helix-turn-helix domain-containing protein [Roseomonas marmotae]MBO1076287.1 helix-turn-helix domain-containing protein [Roseomonas marmotae]QTI77835.1 helix-turn-helix domain-containing protein [Roseomonas marmotae]